MLRESKVFPRSRRGRSKRPVWDSWPHPLFSASCSKSPPRPTPPCLLPLSATSLGLPPEKRYRAPRRPCGRVGKTLQDSKITFWASVSRFLTGSCSKTVFNAKWKSPFMESPWTIVQCWELNKCSIKTTMERGLKLPPSTPQETRGGISLQEPLPLPSSCRPWVPSRLLLEGQSQWAEAFACTGAARKEAGGPRQECPGRPPQSAAAAAPQLCPHAAWGQPSRVRRRRPRGSGHGCEQQGRDRMLCGAPHFQGLEFSEPARPEGKRLLRSPCQSPN